MNIYKLHPNDRIIRVIDRPEQIIVIDARSGHQVRHTVPKGDAERIMVTTKRDMIVVDTKTLAHTIEPLPVRVRNAKPRDTEKRRVTRVCKHLGPEIAGEVFPPSDGLGDMLSNLFASVGVTKERWAALVQQGVDGGVCTGCDGRQTFTNWLGSKLGLPTGKCSDIQKILELTDLPQQSVHVCALHGKCVTELRLSDENKAVVEKRVHLCHGCGQKELVRVELAPSK